MNTSLMIIVGIIAIFALLIVLLVIWGVVVYNRLVRSRNRSTEALQGIDVALESRFDQVKAQADAASGMVKKEVETILEATALRTGRDVRSMEVSEKAKLTTALQDAEQVLLGQSGPSAVLTAEAYPEVRSQQNVEILQRTINEAEERLQAARRVYNGAATAYNTDRQVFPTVLIAGLLGFRDHELFQISDERKTQQHNLEGFLDS